MDYNAYFDNPCYNMAIFAVKCVKKVRCQARIKMLPLIDPGSTAYYLVETEIIDVISLADGYPDIYDNTALVNAHEHGVEAHQVKATVPAPATMRIYGTLFTPNGEIPFQQGRTYLIYGFYHDYPVDTIKKLRHQLLQEEFWIPGDISTSLMRQEKFFASHRDSSHKSRFRKDL